MKYEKLTRVELQALGEEACDFLQVHHSHWPIVRLKRLGMEGDMGEVVWDKHDGKPILNLFNGYLRAQDISQVSTLLHECAHIAIKYGLALDLEDRLEEPIVCLMEHMLYNLYRNGVFNE